MSEAPALRILITDDEAPARRRLHEMLAEIDGADVVGEAADGREAIARVQELAVDVVLMDIAMPVMDGLEAARHLVRLEQPPAVIFCTAYDAHALAAFEAGALDYLLKPIRGERLGQALARARRFSAADADKLRSTTRARSHLSARLGGSLRLIPLADVHYFVAEEKYVVVHHANGADLIEDSLKALEDEFPERLLRVHRSCLVVCDEIAQLDRDSEGHASIRLRSGAGPLEVSRRCLVGLRERLKHL
jgi:two-component system response regulator AlgR